MVHVFQEEIDVKRNADDAGDPLQSCYSSANETTDDNNEPPSDSSASVFTAKSLSERERILTAPVKTNENLNNSSSRRTPQAFAAAATAGKSDNSSSTRISFLEAPTTTTPVASLSSSSSSQQSAAIVEKLLKPPGGSVSPFSGTAEDIYSRESPNPAAARILSIPRPASSDDVLKKLHQQAEKLVNTVVVSIIFLCFIIFYVYFTFFLAFLCVSFLVSLFFPDFLMFQTLFFFLVHLEIFAGFFRTTWSL